MKKIKIVCLKIGIFILNVIYSIIKIFPTQNKITFISRQSNKPVLDFVLLTKKLNQEYPDIKTVMLCKKLENQVLYIFHIFRQMYHIATSKLVILDSYCIPISVLKHKKNLKVMQIWHAVGSMKKFGYAMLGKAEGSDPETTKVMKMHKNYDIVLISSYGFIKDFLEGFNIEREKIVEAPLPRVDLLLDEKFKEKKRNELYKRIPALKGKKNILCCSTFRKDDKGKGKNLTDLIKEIDFKNYNLLYKPHPLNTIKCNDDRVICDFNSTYEALMVADYVICDYSSIIYEVGLLKLPLYLYAYDWEEYKKKRELNLDIEHDTGLLFTANPKEIIDKIENKEFHNEKWEEFVKKNVTIPKEGCTNRIINIITKLLEADKDKNKKL